jgi:hypothetical protein
VGLGLAERFRPTALDRVAEKHRGQVFAKEPILLDIMRDFQLPLGRPGERSGRIVLGIDWASRQHFHGEQRCRVDIGSLAWGVPREEFWSEVAWGPEQKGRRRGGEDVVGEAMGTTKAEDEQAILLPVVVDEDVHGVEEAVHQVCLMGVAQCVRELSEQGVDPFGGKRPVALQEGREVLGRAGCAQPDPSGAALAELAVQHLRYGEGAGGVEVGAQHRDITALGAQHLDEVSGGMRALDRATEVEPALGCRAQAGVELKLLSKLCVDGRIEHE